jgi:hypothetical protein
MSAEERERGPETGVAPPSGVASARDEPAAREAAPPAAADAPGDAPAASEPTTQAGEAAPSNAPGEAAPSDAPRDAPAAAAAPEATDTAAGEPAAAEADAMPAAAPPGPAADAMPNAPDEQPGAAAEVMPAASSPDPPAVAASETMPAAAGEPTVAEADAEPTASEPGLPAIAGTRDGLGAADLRAVLAAVFPSGTPCRHWCARPETIGPLAAGLPDDLAAWAEGRAWSAGAEVRWQQDGPERYRALYLADGDTLPEGFVPLGAGLRALPGEAEPGLYLWGRRGDDGRYHATRLPRALDYPAAAGVEVRVPYQRLVGLDGMVRFLRLTLGEES